MFAIIALGIGILFSNLSTNALAQNSAHLGLDEDEALICIKNTNEQSESFKEEVCKVVQDLDLFGQEYRNKLYTEFGENYDIDTFNIQSLD